MNKYFNYKLSVFICMIALCMSGCSSNKYNFKNIFVLNDDLWARAKKISNADAFVIKLNKSEFERMKPILVKQGFTAWQPLYRICSGKFILENNFGGTSPSPVFSRNYTTKLQGIFPVIVYYSDEGLLYLVIADAIGG